MPFWNRDRNRNNANSTPTASPADTSSANSSSAASTTSNVPYDSYDAGRNSVRPPGETTPDAPAVASATTPEPVLERPEPTGQQTIRMPKGQDYVVKADDVGYNKQGTLDDIGEKFGIIGWRVAQANEGIEEVVEGTTLYLPSSEELLYADCVKKAGDHDKGKAMFAEVSENGGLAVVAGARKAASGQSGESYGTQGVEGKFWASNPELAGASSRRTTTENGQNLYKINWLSSFWKCNLFANEAAYRGGYEPSLKANKHYTTAGGLHMDREHYNELPASQAHAGCIVTLTAGTGSDESHSGVCGNMPLITKDADGNDVVEFTFIGASTDRAKEQDKKITVKSGTNEIVSGDSHTNLRFLKPIKKR